MQAFGERDLGLVEVCQGRTDKSASSLGIALNLVRKLGLKQSEGLVWAHRAFRALLTNSVKVGLEAARKARELAATDRFERDIIQAEWLLGWALIEQSPAASEKHLTEALTRFRRINLVEYEPDILLAWTRWHRATGHPKEARDCVDDALTIADRCEYRLVQADAHNLLARMALDAGDRVEARRHAEIARERAWCDGPPHCYKAALEEAESLLKQIAP